MTSASQYARGTTAWNAVAADQGEAAANAQWQAAIDAERNGTPLDTSTWSIFGNQLYNEPFQAPIEQAGKVAANAASSLGDAAKKVASAAAGNAGIWIIAGILLIAAFFYFGGSAIVRRKIS